ncbi:MAG TPA: hypothetical protein VJZ73_04035 [Methylomirabilota bacterium]|nr:hypothetical protein [Methylomirabilota bacterium]
MTLDEAKTKIMDKICRDRGTSLQWSREDLQQTLGIPPALFSQAIGELVARQFYLEFNVTHVRLSDAGEALCDAQPKATA